MNQEQEKMECPQCEQYKKELQERETKIKILENNILKIKSLLSESGSLIDGYNEIMEENKNLKSENEKLKNEINIFNNNNYQFEILKKKMLRYQQENEELKAIKQFYESQKSENLNIKDLNETKIKRELSQKDKEINQLNTAISLLKMYNNESHLTNEEIIQKYSKIKNNIHNISNSIDDDDQMIFMDNNNDKNNNILKNNKDNYVNNNFKILDLYKEKEFLSEEYQKYKQKYIIYKFKYHEFKKTTKLFMNYMKIIPFGNYVSNFLENMKEEKDIKAIGTKRVRSKSQKNEKIASDYLFNNINAIRNININNQIRKKSDDTLKDILKMPSFFNTNTINDNEENNSGEKEIKIVESEEEDNKEKTATKNAKKKEIKKMNTRKKTIKIKEDEEEKFDNSKNEEEEEKNKREPKKRGRKPKKTKAKKESKKTKSILKIINDSEDEENNNNQREKESKKENDKQSENIDNINREKNKIEKENQKENNITVQNINKEDDKENSPKMIEKHIGPIPKNIKKKLDPEAQKILNSNMLLNLLNNTSDKICRESLDLILSLQNTIHEKISFLFEIIISNLAKIELSRVLTLFEIFIDINEDSKSLIGINILENINMNLNSSNLLSKKIHLKIINKTNDTYKNYINKNFSSPIYLISFLIDILYRKLTDISCINNFIYQLVFDKNIDEKSKNNILLILINTIKESKDDNINDKIYLKKELLNKFISKENENKFYFFISFKNHLISKNILNLSLSIYDRNNINNDTELINQFNTLFNSIPEEELKIEIPNFDEEYRSSIKFNKDIFYLEIFQALAIITETKEIKWIYENIFTKILWKNFKDCKIDSLKRALSIFYTSVLFYLCLKNVKNHENQNLLEQMEFSRLYAWLYSIYNPLPKLENSIGFYERICSLSWIIESPIMTMSTKVYDKIKEVINNNIKGEKESLCPSDFLDKLKKLKLL